MVVAANYVPAARWAHNWMLCTVVITAICYQLDDIIYMYFIFS